MCSGAAEALFLVSSALLGPHTHAVVLSPAFESLTKVAAATGADAFAAGVAAVVALGLLYLALARGKAVIVAPIAATGAAVPVVIGIALGDPVTSVTGIATLLAVAGIVAASWEPASGAGDRITPMTVALAAGSGGNRAVSDVDQRRE